MGHKFTPLTPGPGDLLTMREAAQFLGTTRQCLANSYKKWGVPFFRLGRRIRFHQPRLEQWIQQKSA